MNLLGIILTIAVSASIDSTTLWIGNQTTMHLEAQTSQSTQIIFPELGHELTAGVEIIERMPIDTTFQGDNMHLKQDLVITSFQDSLYYIDSIPFVSGNDTIYANGVSLNVIQPFVIDTANAGIFDIKDIEKAPVWWWGIIRWILLALLIAGLGVGIYYLVKRLRKKDVSNEPVPQEPLRPADELALEKLNQIKEDKIWQQGRTKDYYSEITNVLREYISRVFEIDSVEMTTYEILDSLKKPLKTEENTWKQLKRILSLADLVKFAKWSPLPDENEATIKESVDFVNNTRHFIKDSTDDNSTEQQPETK